MNDFRFKKSLGQNFLVDDNIKRKIVNSASVGEDSIIIEVGPGNGAITRLLVNFGVPVIAFEVDERLKSELEKIDSENLKVIFQDFLSVDLSLVLSNYKVISETSVDEMIVMVQKEVGIRFMAKPNSKNYNSLSVFLQYYFDVSKVTLVSKNSFFPKPNVDSVVIKFSRKSELLKVNDLDFFFRFVRDAFTQKRKNLRNNLKSYDLDLIENALSEIGKDLTFRAEQLSIEDFVHITNFLK